MGALLLAIFFSNHLIRACEVKAKSAHPGRPFGPPRMVFCLAFPIQHHGGARCGIERSLFHKAVGYSYETQELTKDGTVVTLTKHVAPETVAMIFWLKNRRPKEWRDAHRHEVGTPGDFDPLTNQELEAKIIEDAKALGATPEALEVLRLTFQPKRQDRAYTWHPPVLSGKSASPPIVLQNSFCTGDQYFCGPQTRLGVKI
jgi:hypothetical protein